MNPEALENQTAEIERMSQTVEQFQKRLEKAIKVRNYEIQEAYKVGMTIAQLSRAANVSRNTIHKIVNQETT